MPLLTVRVVSVLPQLHAVLYVCIGVGCNDDGDSSGCFVCLMDRDRCYPFDRVPPVGATYTHVTTDRKHLLMCQINTSAVTTVGDDYGGINTTDVVLPSSARGQFAQSSFLSIRVVVVTKKPSESESGLKELC